MPPCVVIKPLPTVMIECDGSLMGFLFTERSWSKRSNMTSEEEELQRSPGLADV